MLNMAKERNGTVMVGAWIDREQAEPFIDESKGSHGRKSEIIREMLHERYEGKSSLSPLGRKIAAAFRSLEGSERGRVAEALLRIAVAARDPRNERTILTVADSLEAHGLGARGRGPLRKVGRGRRAGA